MFIKLLGIDGREYALNCNFVFVIDSKEDDQTVLFSINNMQYLTLLEFDIVHKMYDQALKLNAQKRISYKVPVGKNKYRILNPNYILALGMLNDDEGKTEISMINDNKFIIGKPIKDVLTDLKDCFKR